METSNESKTQPISLTIFDVDVPADLDLLGLLELAPKWAHVNGDRDLLIAQLGKELKVSKTDLKTFAKRLDKITPKPEPEPTQAPNPDEAFWTNLAPGEHGNAMVFLKLHGKIIAYNSAYGWLVKSQKQKRWVNGDLAEARLDQMAIDMLLERQRRAVAIGNDAIARQAVCTTRNISNVKAMSRPYVTVLPDQFDSDPNLLNTKSGVIDLRTGKIVADESGKFTYCCPVEYDPTADFKPWLAWLDDTVEFHKDDEKMQEWLQMCWGYSVTGHTNEECFFYLHGPRRSGKGTKNAVQLAMLGDPLARGAAFSTFTRKRTEGNAFDLAPLKAARLIVASEGDKKVSLNTSMIKNITGRDPITTAFKGKDEFTYYPAYKIWLASNWPASGDPDDDAFWGRAKIISCPWSKYDSEDKGMKQRMTSPDYLKTVLAYTVLGARMWFNNPQGLITPDCVKRRTNEQREAGDSIGLWLADNTQESIGAEISHAVLHADYTNWCNENGFSPKMGKWFAESMSKKGHEQTKFYVKVYGENKQVRGYTGVALTAK